MTANTDMLLSLINAKRFKQSVNIGWERHVELVGYLTIFPMVFVLKYLDFDLYFIFTIYFLSFYLIKF